MNDYMVLYRDENVMSPSDHPFGFSCRADNLDHAEEQCLNAYPEVDIVWVARDVTTLAEALDDYYGS